VQHGLAQCVILGGAVGVRNDDLALGLGAGDFLDDRENGGDPGTRARQQERNVRWLHHEVARRCAELDRVAGLEMIVQVRRHHSVRSPVHAAHPAHGDLQPMSERGRGDRVLAGLATPVGQVDEHRHVLTGRDLRQRQAVGRLQDERGHVRGLLDPADQAVRPQRDANLRLDYGLTAFTFLGFTFRARAARTKHGTMFVCFQPAISKDAQLKISGQIRRWRLHRWIGLSLADIARQINPVVRGWMQYYGAFYRSTLYPLLSRINAYVMRWIRNKHKRLRTTKKAKACWQRITRQHPRLFAHWAWVHGSWRTG
jgi:RNA-directed DNA polymerase